MISFGLTTNDLMVFYAIAGLTLVLYVAGLVGLLLEKRGVAEGTKPSNPRKENRAKEE